MPESVSQLSVGSLVGGISSILVALSVFIEIAPIKVNPWTWLAKKIGKALNGDVLDELNYMKNSQIEMQKRLDEHIRIDDERNADLSRTRILRFNNEIMRGVTHTEEDYIDALGNIDSYETYCRSHPGYKNNRATHAISNIERAFDERQIQNDFL